MNPTSKKLISLFLVLSLLMINCVSLRTTGGKREKRGAELIITKKNGVKIEGELIAVRWNSLLILTKWTGRDVSVDIIDVEVITIVKKSKAGKGALFGALAGVGGSVLAGILIGDVVEDMGFHDWAMIVGLFSVPGGAIIGAIIGGIVSKRETIKIEGMSDLEIRRTLNYLRMKARTR